MKSQKQSNYKTLINQKVYKVGIVSICKRDTVKWHYRFYRSCKKISIAVWWSVNLTRPFVIIICFVSIKKVMSISLIFSDNVLFFLIISNCNLFWISVKFRLCLCEAFLFYISLLFPSVMSRKELRNVLHGKWYSVMTRNTSNTTCHPQHVPNNQ